MTRIDLILTVVLVWSTITVVAMRLWCHSHLRSAHPAEFDVVEQSYDRPWIFFLNYPLSECHRNSLTHFLYRTCLRGSTCQDCIWMSWLVIAVDGVWLITGITLLIRFSLAK